MILQPHIIMQTILSMINFNVLTLKISYTKNLHCCASHEQRFKSLNIYSYSVSIHLHRTGLFSLSILMNWENQSLQVDDAGEKKLLANMNVL